MSKLNVLYDENKVQEKILEIANELNKKYNFISIFNEIL